MVVCEWCENLGEKKNLNIYFLFSFINFNYIFFFDLWDIPALV